MVLDTFSVHLPVSLVADFSELRMKTLKIGQVGRFLAIFGVDKVFVYDDGAEQVEGVEDEASIIVNLLRYMETPQYLRKDLFPHMEELQFVGILPPLRTPHHPLQDERNEAGDIREAVVIGSEDGQSRLNIGLSEEGVIDKELEEGDRLTVKLGEKIGGNKRNVQIVEKRNISKYWGYEVEKTKNLAQSLKKAKADYSIGTSRYGENLYEAVEGIKSNADTNGLTIAFGGPYEGLFEICERQDVNSDDLFDNIINTVPEQRTETVRSEEALAATLAVLNVLLRRN